MRKPSEKKQLPYERILFFTDAVVAIAITLLALNLKLDPTAHQRLSLSDLLKPWHGYAGFALSFISIAGLWNTHHNMYIYIKKMDPWLQWFNTFWLFFIAILPFTTSILSNHYRETTGVFLYATNMLFITIFQKLMWDYAKKRNYINFDEIEQRDRRRYSIVFNLHLLNACTAMIISIFAPFTAFFLLFFKIPLFLFGSFYVVARRRHAKRNAYITEASNTQFKP